MKHAFILSFCTIALACTALGQTPTPPPLTSPAPTLVASPTIAPSNPAIAPIAAIPAVSATPVPAATAAPDNDEDFDKMIERRINRHFRVNIDGDHSNHGDDLPWIAIPIVLIVFLTIFGLPVAIVGLILYFSFSRSRAMHKTVRMMVEKGQPVPEALLNPPPVVRRRSDLRRGVILLMVGAGLMVFFGAVNDWEGGAWSLGFIPFIIGLGYLLVWRLDTRKEEPSTKV
ncbi:MAG TPA: DUF6249 domain-containing protein [Chthoniobacterales bacterium]